MVYHRNLWNYYIVGLAYGLFRGDLLKTRSIHRSIQGMTDGAIARSYSVSEWKQLAGKYFAVDKINIFGQKSETVPLPGGNLKKAILRIFPDSTGRFLTNSLRMGTFLVSSLPKVGPKARNTAGGGGPPVVDPLIGPASDRIHPNTR